MRSKSMISFTGNLTEDAKFKKIGDRTVANFSVAVNPDKDGEPIYYRCATWGKLAEAYEKHGMLTKGGGVSIAGEFKPRKYDGGVSLDVETFDVSVHPSRDRGPAKATAAATGDDDGYPGT